MSRFLSPAVPQHAAPEQPDGAGCPITGAAGGMPAGWTSGPSRQSRRRSRRREAPARGSRSTASTKSRGAA